MQIKISLLSKKRNVPKPKQPKTFYLCSNCGYKSLKWSGKCPSCGEWETLEEQTEVVENRNESSFSAGKADVKDFTFKFKRDYIKRQSTGIGEVDRVLGGGIVPGEVVLLSGEPGIGKSTLLLEVCGGFANVGPVLYVTGEESITQFSTRAERILAKNKNLEANLKVTEEINVDRVIESIRDLRPSMVVVDSIQSIYTEQVNSFSGSMSQVRECGVRLTRCAKSLQIPIFIVGQVTKEGVVAGPKVLEHVVDSVLYFEGDEFGMYRILRCIKNRFGTTDEVGIFEMTSNGLVEVSDPSGAFCVERNKPQTGVAVAGVFKGSRVLFVEIQALTSLAAFGAPRRLPTGMGKARLEMLCAVLTRRAGVNLSGDDVFVNVAGGLKLDDPAIDLAVCAAIASAKKDKPLSKRCAFVGEIGLSGDIRKIAFQDRVLAEAKRRKLTIIGNSQVSGFGVRNVVKELFAGVKQYS